MTDRSGKTKMSCPRCSSTDLVVQKRSNLGGTGHIEAIETEMLGCAIIYKYLVCSACSRIISREEYQKFLSPS